MLKSNRKLKEMTDRMRQKRNYYEKSYGIDNIACNVNDIENTIERSHWHACAREHRAQCINVCLSACRQVDRSVSSVKNDKRYHDAHKYAVLCCSLSHCCRARRHNDFIVHFSIDIFVGALGQFSQYTIRARTKCRQTLLHEKRYRGYAMQVCCNCFCATNDRDRDRPVARAHRHLYIAPRVLNIEEGHRAAILSSQSF